MTDDTTHDLNTLMTQIECLRGQGDDLHHSLMQKNATVFAVLSIVVSDLLSGLLVGGAIGYMCYHYLHCHLIVCAVLILLGGFAGLINMHRSLSQLERKDVRA